MFVLTSVIVTVTPGSTRPDASLTLPSRDPFTACAAATADDARTSRTIVPHAASVRPQRRYMNPPYVEPTWRQSLSRVHATVKDGLRQNEGARRLLAERL